MIATIKSEVKDNCLYIGGVSLEKLAKEYGTPLYIYDQEDIEYRIDRTKKAFKSRKVETNIAYASKAILTSYIAKLMQHEGLSIDAISLSDMYILKKSGFELKNVYLHGNSKSDEELYYAIENGVGIIVVDNLCEISRIKEIVADLKKKTAIMVRINPDIYAKTHSHLITAEKNAKFGVAKESISLKEELVKLKSEKLIDFQGLHCHIGSQVNNGEAFLTAVNSMIELAYELEKEFGIDVKELNFGGGFAIRQNNAEKEPDTEKLLSGIIKLVDRKAEELDIGLQRVTIEPGRSLVGPAGVTLYQVEAIKQTAGGVNYIMVDGGMTDNIRPSLYGARYDAVIVNKVEAKKQKLFSVAGKCCESGDILIKDIKLPEVCVSEYVALFATGAYNYSMASNYNGLVKPAIVFVKNGKQILTTKREEIAQVHQNDLETEIM